MKPVLSECWNDVTMLQRVEMMSPRLQHEACHVWVLKWCHHAPTSNLSCLWVLKWCHHGSSMKPVMSECWNDVTMLQHQTCPVFECWNDVTMLQHQTCPVFECWNDVTMASAWSLSCLSVEMMSPCSNIKPVLSVWVEMMSPCCSVWNLSCRLSVEMMSPCSSLKPVLSVSAGLPVASWLWSYTRHGDWQQELWPDACGGGVHHGALAGQDLPREGFEQSPEAEKSQQTGEEGETEILAEGQSGWRWNAMGLKGTRSRGRVCMEIENISICGLGLLAVFYVLGEMPACWNKACLVRASSFKALQEHNCNKWGIDSSGGRVLGWKLRHSTDTGLIPQCRKGFSPRVSFHVRSFAAFPQPWKYCTCW